MTAYVVGHFTIHDRETYMTYAGKTGESIAPFGGEFLAKGGEAEWLEGAGHDRHVIIAFPDMAAIRAWFASPAYKDIEPLRHASSTGELLALDGL